MTNKTLIKIALVLLLVLIITIFMVFYGINHKEEQEDFNFDFKINYEEDEISGEYQNIVANINLNEDNIVIDGSGATINNNTLTIKSTGAYYITGTSSNCNIVIEAGKNDNVQLILDNATITSQETAAINGVEANKLTITLAENSKNSITDASNYTNFTDEQDSEPNGAIFTKTDLIINGTGNLTVNANYQDGIVSKDGLKIINCSLDIKSADDAIRGKDYLAINNANIVIDSDYDGLKSTNSTDSSLGYIVIDSGEININAGDDGIHASTALQINGGNINIKKSYEGLESSYIEINGGNINVVSSDDGINVAGGNDNSAINGRIGQNTFTQTSKTNRKLVINGGDINVKASGDGLDSNGSIYINGGKTIVAGSTNGGNGALDYDSECVVTDGTLIAYGATGMWQNPSENSTQYTVNFNTTGKKGDTIVLKNENGEEILSFESSQTYQSILFSDNAIEKGKIYSLYINNEKIDELTVNSIITSNSTGNNMFDIKGQQWNKKN